jgi:hypothetical protein
MRILPLILAVPLLSLSAQASTPAPSHPSAGKPRSVHAATPASQIIVLLPNRTYELFAPAEVSTLQALLDKLPKGAVHSARQIRLIRKGEFVTFSLERIPKDKLAACKLDRWDVVQIIGKTK